MALMYSYIIYIGVPLTLIIVLALLLIKKKPPKYEDGIKVANTTWLKELPEFKKAHRKHTIFSTLTKISLVVALLSSLMLGARPYRTSTINSGLKKRDIFLCLDVSYSIYELNYALVDQLKEVVSSMQGDRFGISIFNTSTVLYVPLTDDYDFISEKLDDLKDYFLLQKDYWETFRDYEYIPSDMYEQYSEMVYELSYLDAGTLVNNHYKGSSLIGEGLASCLYSFPYLNDESRTRVIILSTDNGEMANAKPIVELDEASQLCKEHDVHIFGIFPDKESYDRDSLNDYDNNLKDFIKNIEGAGGIVYEQSKSLTVEDIVKNIQKDEAMTIKEISTTKTIDEPSIFVVSLVISLVVFLISLERLNRG